MELNQGTFKASKLEPEDFISNMPDNVITNIMDRLPLQYAVRTSILSRNWKSKWNLLSQIVCDQNFSKYILKKGGQKSLWRIILMILHNLQCPITKFVFTCYSENVGDIIHCVLFLLKKGIKVLIIKHFNFEYKYEAQPLKLPICFFSCLELKHLNLHNCCFDPPSSFHGFPNLLILELHQVQIKSGKFWELFPALEILYMGNAYQTIKVMPVEIGKLVNLKMLSLFMSNLRKPNFGSIFELLGFLPKLNKLHLNFVSCKLTDAGAKNACTTICPCIKTLKLSTIDLVNSDMLSFAFEMIRSFPNLQNLEIKASERDIVPIVVPEVDYNTTELLQLRSVTFRNLKGLKNEVSLINYLVTCSPFLKKVVIHSHSRLAQGELVSFAGKLLKLQRAYPVVDINLH